MYFITVDYPERAEELEVIQRTTGRAKPTVNAIFNAADLLTAQAMVRDVPIASHLLAYALALVRATRRQRGAEGDVAPDFVKQYHSHPRGNMSETTDFIDDREGCQSENRLAPSHGNGNHRKAHFFSIFRANPVGWL